MRKLLASLAVALLLLTAAHSEPARDGQLERIRDEIHTLRKRLDVVKTEQKTAQQELEEVQLELDIRTRELCHAENVDRAQLPARRQRSV